MTGIGQTLILLVEDTPADVMVIKMALRRLESKVRLEVVKDGQAALDYLAGKGRSKDRRKYPLPNLILLDLGLTKIDGFHVLEWVRTEPTLRHLPVVILAASSSTPDIQRAYAFGANTFITKPSDFNKLVTDLQLALQHWLPHALLGATQQALAQPQTNRAA